MRNIEIQEKYRKEFWMERGKGRGGEGGGQNGVRKC
jgi:hypothetical protein